MMMMMMMITIITITRRLKTHFTTHVPIKLGHFQNYERTEQNEADMYL